MRSTVERIRDLPCVLIDTPLTGTPVAPYSSVVR